MLHLSSFVWVGKPLKNISFDDLRSWLPASDREIRTALTKHRVVDLDDRLRSVPPAFLLRTLPPLFSTLPVPAAIAHPARAQKAPPLPKKSKPSSSKLAGKGDAGPLVAEADESDLVDALDSVDCGRSVALEIVAWFGERLEGARDGTPRWRLDVNALVRELGIVLLADGGFGKQRLDAFLTRWKDLSGGFAPVCDVSLLSGVHILHPPPVSMIQYLPASSLSPDPATRFAELFSLNARWPEAELSRFIDDLTAGDKKKRDALVLKFVRKVKDKQDETWWTPRNLWS
ncbi:hypothetical protein JCM11491_006597 [Sporobolomyces phaffii]